jgi:hypothetical protein
MRSLVCKVLLKNVNLCKILVKFVNFVKRFIYWTLIIDDKMNADRPALSLEPAPLDY